VKLDQLELIRIGSEHFRPDIRVQGLAFEQVHSLFFILETRKGSQGHNYDDGPSGVNVKKYLANPTTAVCDARAVKICSGTSSLVQFENKNIFF
jgi:hypothetical protein